MRWLQQASDELIALAKSQPPGSGTKAGQIFEFAQKLSSQRAGDLPRLGRGNPDIRWWDIGGVTVYFRVDIDPMLVLHIGKSGTPQQRSLGQSTAKARC